MELKYLVDPRGQNRIPSDHAYYVDAGPAIHSSFTFSNALPTKHCCGVEEILKNILLTKLSLQE